MEKCLIQFSKTNNYINECIQCKYFACRIVSGWFFIFTAEVRQRACVLLWGKWSVPWGALQWQWSPLSVHRGWGGLGRAALTSPPCGSNFRSGIQETAMTATRTETITFSQLPFYCRFAWQLCHLRKSEVSRVTFCPPAVCRWDRCDFSSVNCRLFGTSLVQTCFGKHKCVVHCFTVFWKMTAICFIKGLNLHLFRTAH